MCSWLEGVFIGLEKANITYSTVGTIAQMSCDNDWLCVEQYTEGPWVL